MASYTGFCRGMELVVSEGAGCIFTRGRVALMELGGGDKPVGYGILDQVGCILKLQVFQDLSLVEFNGSR